MHTLSEWCLVILSISVNYLPASVPLTSSEPVTLLIRTVRTPPSTHTHTHTQTYTTADGPSRVAIIHFQDQIPIILPLPPPFFPSVLSLTFNAFWQSDGLVGIRISSTVIRYIQPLRSHTAHYLQIEFTLMINPMSSNPVYQKQASQMDGKSTLTQTLTHR